MTAHPLSFRQRFGYGIGDFGFNLFFTTASLYLLYYYTDVLGLPPATAGWVFAVALVWDAVFDPVMGYLADKTRTRWGRFRPYLLYGGLPLAASWALMFLPISLSGAPLVLFALSTHILFRTLYAVVSMPYLALSATMTRDSHERGVLAGMRMVAATLCGLFVAIATLTLVGWFGGGAVGFFRTACVYGVMATIVFFAVFASVRETEPSETAPTARQMVEVVRRNRPFGIVCIAMLASAFGGTMLSKMLPYHFKYALQRPDAIGLGLMVMTGAVALSIPVWTRIMARTSKRVVWLSGVAIGLIGYALLWQGAVSVTTMLPALVLLGLGSGGGYLGFWSMMPDTVEYAEAETGIRSEGAIFGIVSLIQKAGFGLAAALLGEMLGAIGYRANAAQSADTLFAMKVIMIGGGASLSIVSAAAIAFYPIDRAHHAKLLDRIAGRVV